MKVLVTGASGLVGSALARSLSSSGHTVLRLVRREVRGPDEVRWKDESGWIDAPHLDGLDAVVHLAGESIGSGRWTAAKMRRIRESRTDGTRTLATALAGLSRRPRVLVSASAVGFYGDRGDERLDERSSTGADFLAEVCRSWEAACDPARAAGIRVVNVRLGMVLGRDGGALPRMLLPFKLGLGGKIGSGRQYVSWIALDDAVAGVRYVLDHDELSGPLNLVSPNPVTNLELTKALGRVLRRPTLAPLPAFAARIVLGKMADALLLGSARVLPQGLSAAGFRWSFPSIDGALRHVLGRT